MAQTNAVAKKATTNVASKTNDAFMAQVLQAASAEQSIRNENGSSLSWITGPLGGDSEILEPTSSSHIKGAAKNGYVITNKKLNLGTSFNAIVIGMFKVFAEQTVPKSDKEMSKTVSYWLPEDAMEIPTGDNNFDRPLANGNVLKPVHWVFLYLPDHPELEGVVMSFRSTGNKFYTELEKVVKASSKMCPELLFTVSSQPLKNETYNKTYYYPKFELQEQRNFTFSGEGDAVSIKSVKGGLASDELKEVLTRYSDVYNSFVNQKTIVAKKVNLSRYLLNSTTVDAQVIDDEDDGEEIKF